MTENVESLILEHLRGMRGGQERIEHELREEGTRQISRMISRAAATCRCSYRSCGE